MKTAIWVIADVRLERRSFRSDGHVAVIIEHHNPFYHIPTHADRRSMFRCTRWWTFLSPGKDCVTRKIYPGRKSIYRSKDIIHVLVKRSKAHPPVRRASYANGPIWLAPLYLDYRNASSRSLEIRMHRTLSERRPHSWHTPAIVTGGGDLNDYRCETDEDFSTNILMKSEMLCRLCVAERVCDWRKR